MAERTYIQDPVAEQDALRESLMTQAEGGAINDPTQPVSQDPATQQLLQEQVYNRTYGDATPTFAEQVPGTPGGSTEQGLIDRINAAYPDINNMTQDELAAAEMARIQNQIDAINAMYNVRVQEENRKGEGRLGSTRALNALSGSLYDPFGAGRTEETASYNREVVSKIQAERANLIAGLTSEAAARAQGQFQENSRLAMEKANSYVSAITNAYQLNQQEAQALRQEALQRAQMTGDLNGDPTLSYRQYLLDVTTQLENSQRQDEELNLRKQEFERAGYQTQVMPNGQLVAIDYRTYPPTTTVIGNYAPPRSSGGGGGGGDGYNAPQFDELTGTYYYAPTDPTAGLAPIRLTADGQTVDSTSLADTY